MTVCIKHGMCQMNVGKQSNAKKSTMEESKSTDDGNGKQEEEGTHTKMC